jgi:hypothetical protein
MRRSFILHKNFVRATPPPHCIVQVFVLLLYKKAIILNFVSSLALSNTKSLNCVTRKMRMALLHLIENNIKSETSNIGMYDN